MSISATQSGMNLHNKRQKCELEVLQLTQLPNEIIEKIARYIGNDQDLARFASVCRTFKQVIESKQELSLRRHGVWDFAFGKAKWTKYFGDIGIEPPLPNNISQILNSVCPFWAGEKVRDTHVLTLIPSHINGIQLTLESIGELVKNPQNGGHATKYFSFRAYGNEKCHVNQNTWVLMTRDLMPDSQQECYKNQQQLIANLAEKSGLHYEVPHLIEAVTSIFMEYVVTGYRLYGNDNPWIYTRCQEKERVDNRYQMVVGGFAAGGLDVNDYEFWVTDGIFGVGGSRKL